MAAEYAGAPAPLRTGLARDAAFSFRCHACKRCCRNKTIQVNPYELARLSRGLGLPVADVVERYTDGGVHLRQREDGNCVFLGAAGCSVHGDRPLVCRLYPLGRIVGPDGEEFVDVAPHPQTAGAWGTDGTIADYLDQQGALPCLELADAYFGLFLALLQVPDGAAAIQPREMLDIDAFAGGAGDHVAMTIEARAHRHVRQLAVRAGLGEQEKADYALKA
jgi:Fe-S-cluster containining protein